MLYGATNAEKIWNYFKSVGMSEYGIAGLIGNLDCESALNPKNLQDSFEAVSGFADEVSKELPLEYAMEMNNLIRLEMKGSIG